ncbi:response regulator [Aquipuribacter hungaricus]|uniref:Response regulator n=1 Tax=Aquipuribacter hungaricus TaxID=545624 RepID=A0ABV7WMU4_9MICO
MTRADPSAMPLRIVLVDDHPVVRAGLRALLDGQPDLSVVGEADSATSAERVVTATNPDIVLMDLALGVGPGGATATAALRQLPDPPQVLVLTAYETEADILAALQAGARGFLLKDAPPAELFHAVRHVAHGRMTLAPTVAARLAERASAPAPALSPREIEILGLLAQGRSNRDMANHLFLSEATIKSHLSHIYAKLRVDSRAGAVAHALEHHIVRTARPD